MAKAAPIELIVKYDDSAVVKGISRTEKAVSEAMKRIQSPAMRGAALNEAFLSSTSEQAEAYKAVADEAEKSGKRRKTAAEGASVSEATASRQRMDLLREEMRAGMARASQENDLFNRQRLTLKAQTEYRLAVYKDNAAMVERILQTHSQKLIAISNRESGFSATPFQTMLTQQKAAIGQSSQFIALMSKMGLSSKEAGRVIQNAGFQVGDFAVQVASGQGVMRPFIQQATQLIQGFGPWGAVIGAAGAAIGGLLMYLNNGKRGVEEFTSSIKEADFARFAQQIQTLQAAFAVLNTVQTEGVRRYDAYGYAALAAGDKVRTANKAVKENEAGLIRLFGSIENARAAYERLQNQSSKGLDFDLRMSTLQLGADTKDNAVAQQRLRNEQRLEEVRKGFDSERAAIAGWEQRKSSDGKKVIETAEQLAERQRQAITEIVRRQKEDEGKAVTLGNNEISKVEAEYGKKSTEESKKRAAERVRAEESAFKAIIDGRQKQIEALRNKTAVESQIDQDLAIRRQVATGASDLAQLEGRHARERAAMQKQLDDQILNLDLSVSEYTKYYDRLRQLEEVQGVERKTATEKAFQERTAKIQEANQKIAASYMSIAGVIAETWAVGPLQKALTWLQRIQTVLTAIQTIKTGSAAGGSLLGILGLKLGAAAAATAISGPAGLGVATTLALAKNQSTQPYIPTPTASARVATTQPTSLAKSSGGVTIGSVSFVMPKEALSVQGAERFGKIAAKSLHDELKSIMTPIRDAEYSGVTP